MYPATKRLNQELETFHHRNDTSWQEPHRHVHQKENILICTVWFLTMLDTSHSLQSQYSIDCHSLPVSSPLSSFSMWGKTPLWFLHYSFPLNWFPHSTLCFPTVLPSLFLQVPKGDSAAISSSLHITEGLIYTLYKTQLSGCMVWRLISTNTKEHRCTIPSSGTQITW